MKPNKVADRLDVLAEDFHALRGVKIDGISATNWYAAAEVLAFTAWFFRKYNGRTLSAPTTKEAFEEYLRELK